MSCHSIKYHMLMSFLLTASPILLGANHSIYEQLIHSVLLNTPPYCLGVKNIAPSQPISMWEQANYHALNSAGLLTKHNDKNSVIYDIADEYKADYKKYNDFCYGRMELDKLINYHQSEQNIVLIYTYQIKDMPVWALNQDLQFAFSELDFIVNGIAQRTYSIEFIKISSIKYRRLSQPQPTEIILY